MQQMNCEQTADPKAGSTTHKVAHDVAGGPACRGVHVVQAHCVGGGHHLNNVLQARV
jgi:hypothetical protein